MNPSRTFKLDLGVYKKTQSEVGEVSERLQTKVNQHFMPARNSTANNTKT